MHHGGAWDLAVARACKGWGGGGAVIALEARGFVSKRSKLNTCSARWDEQKKQSSAECLFELGLLLCSLHFASRLTALAHEMLTAASLARACSCAALAPVVGVSYASCLPGPWLLGDRPAG